MTIIGPKKTSVLPTVTSAIANRTNPPKNAGVSAVPFMSRTAHFSMVAISSLQVEFANWGDITETNNGGTVSVTASVEYPAGTFTQIKFGGSANGSIAPGATLTSDACTVAIPVNTPFWLRFFQQSTVGLPFSGAPRALNLGDICQSNGTDQTMGGTIVENGGTNVPWPLAIIGSTNQDTLGFVGDSRVVGQQPFAVDPSGFVGDMAPSFAAQFAYLNCGIGGETAQGFLANSAKRRAVIANITRVVLGFGINDVAAGRTAAQIYTDLTSIKALFAGKKTYLLTVAPRSTSTNNWSAADGSDQTAVGNSAVIDSLNTLILANSAGFDAVFDVSPAARLGTNQDLWNASGVANWATGDGLHESARTNNAYNFVMPP